MIATAAALAMLLAGEPTVMPIAARPRVHYFIRKRKARPPAPPESTRAEAVPEPAQKRVRTIPIIDFDSFYRRVGL